MTQIFLSALPNQSGQLLCDMLSSGYVYVTCFPQVTRLKARVFWKLTHQECHSNGSSHRQNCKELGISGHRETSQHSPFHPDGSRLALGAPEEVTFPF